MCQKLHLFRPGTIGPYCGISQPEHGGWRELLGTDDKEKFSRIAANPEAVKPACKRCLSADKRSPTERAKP